jgi:enterochelin esterase-like enzyme
MRNVRILSALLVAVWWLAAGHQSVRAQTGATGIVKIETINSESLQGNATGEPTARRVSVYLPASYETSPDRRYPVVYLLHGIQDSDQTWTIAWPSMSDRAPYNTIQNLLDLGSRDGAFGEMIVVMPEAGTRLGGSFYVNSDATGNWEDYIAVELVKFIDDRYRTLASPESRGIGGHSMGGYGAVSIAMRRPGIFGAVYALNPAVLGWGGEVSSDNPAFGAVSEARSFQDLAQIGPAAFAIVALAQAFSPNRSKPPLFIDLPYAKSGSEIVPVPGIIELWDARFPVKTVQERRASFDSLAGFRFDTAWEDEYPHIPITSRAFARELAKAGVDFRFDEYNGDHRNRLWGRQGRLFTDFLPFFWRTLKSSSSLP